MEFQIRALTPDCWETFKSVRLRALSDTPDAFGSTLEKELGYTKDDWRKRLERTDCSTFIAVSKENKPIGLITAGPYDEVGGLFAMWVDPSVRNKGVGGGLVDAVILWAKENDFGQLLLDVADDNLSAIQLYKSKGFSRTGVTGTLPPPRAHIREHQRCLTFNQLSEPITTGQRR